MFLFLSDFSLSRNLDESEIIEPYGIFWLVEFFTNRIILFGRDSRIGIDSSRIYCSSGVMQRLTCAADVVCFVTDKNRLSDEACINDGDN